LTPTPAQWENLIVANEGHLLQTGAWGELKSRFGWVAVRVQVESTAAQILFRRLPLGFTIAYIPKGPILDWTLDEQRQPLFSAIHAEAKKRRAIFLKVEPHMWQTGSFSPPAQAKQAQMACAKAATDFLQQSGFRPADTIQPRTSLVIDISGDEDSILAAMKQKTRYNIRLAQKKEVTVRLGEAADVATFHRLALTTSNRNEFGVHQLDYYQAAYELFAPDRCALLLAEFKKEPLAALMVFRQGPDAYYFYGASSNTQRNRMPTYLIQWAAIGWAKEQGCHRYDLWGIPDADPAVLEAEFQHRHGGLWGVYRFKRGFGGEVVRSVGAYDYVYNPLLYQLYKLRRRTRNDD
jgi:peptidoglycan pentaglycine glycine transferase (the first glycine)